jgi:hypothetical protein
MDAEKTSLDLDKEFGTFVQQLRTPPKETKVPPMVPVLAEPIVSRQGELKKVNAALLHDSPTSVVLCGAGGAGKTTLARDFCQQPEIQELFDDGVLWVTLGTEPNVTSELASLYAVLTGERPGFFNKDDAALHLSEVIEDRRLLFVIDDVWDSAHLEPFLRAPNCS